MARAASPIGQARNARTVRQTRFRGHRSRWVTTQVWRRVRTAGFARFEAMVARIPITNVSPVLEQGRYPVKAVPGETLTRRGERVPRGARPARRRRRPDRPEGQGPRRWSTMTPARRSRAATAPRSRPTPKAPGPTGSSRGPTRTAPGSTPPRSRSPAEIDVELMFTEGALAPQARDQERPAAHP